MNEFDKSKQAGMDYAMAIRFCTIRRDRWEKGIDHHPMSERIMRFLEIHDYTDNNDYFCWKIGGDGDNGEALMYELDAFFEMLDLMEKNNE